MKGVRFLSICSGLEGASLAFEPLGWIPVGFAEIEAFPAAILAERYGSNLPGEPLSRNAPPNHGDFTAIDVDSLPEIDALVGGTPCQAFSVAGKRLSLADARGNLTLAFAVLAHELARSHGLRNAIWENVPGVLSTIDNAFGCFLGALVGGDDAIEPVGRPKPGKSNTFWRWRKAGVERDEDGNEIAVEEGHITRWPRAGMVAGPLGRAAWRVLDAQYFGVAQRRERVFVVVDFGNGADPAAVLFERKGMSGHSPPSRSQGQGIACTLAAGSRSSGGYRNDADTAGNLVAFGGNRTGGPIDVSPALNAHGGPHGRMDFESEAFVTHALRAEGFDASEDGTGRGTPIVPVAFSSKDYGNGAAINLSPTLRAMPGEHANAGGQIAVAFDLRGRDGGAMPEGPHDTANIRAASGGSSRSYVAQAIDLRNGELADVAMTLQSGGMGDQRGLCPNAIPHTISKWAVRRLTPRECERLQGVPDGHTLIPWRGKTAADCPDGPRYKALGNSWAVPVVRWIGERLTNSLNQVDQ